MDNEMGSPPVMRSSAHAARRTPPATSRPTFRIVVAMGSHRCATDHVWPIAEAPSWLSQHLDRHAAICCRADAQRPGLILAPAVPPGTSRAGTRVLGAHSQPCEARAARDG